MKQYYFNPNRKDTLVLALVYLILGLALCFFSGSLLTAIVRAAGVILILYGAYQLYIYFGVHKNTDAMPMMTGVPSLIFGLILTVWPNMLISFFPIVAGFLLILNSIMQIQKSLVLKSNGYSNWIITLTLAFLMLAVGIILIIRPMGIINLILRFTGLALVVEAVILIAELFLNRSIRRH